MKNQACKKISCNSRYKRDINFSLICNTRRRIHQILKGKIKSCSTKEVLGIEIKLYRKWLEWQMTPEMNWTNIEIDHVKPICLFDVPKAEEKKKHSPGKILSPYSNMIISLRE